jgi:hypothetical protein
MIKFTLKTYKSERQTEKPHLYILNKGLNSGKPLKQPCPNCFVLTAKSEEEVQSIYWLCFGLWKAKSFHYYLKGSVIPFITINDMRTAIKNSYEIAQEDKPIFQKSVKTLQLLEEKEKQYLQNIQLINDAKRVIFYRYIKHRKK